MTGDRWLWIGIKTGSPDQNDHAVFADLKFGFLLEQESESWGVLLVDATVNTNHGVVQGTMRNSGLAAWSREFDGVDDFVHSGSADKFDIDDAMTFSAWLKPVPEITGTAV